VTLRIEGSLTGWSMESCGRSAD